MRKKGNKHNSKIKKTLKYISSGFFIAVFLLVAFVFVNLIVEKITSKPSDLLLYRFYYIVTDSMSGNFDFKGETLSLQVDDLIFSRSVNEKNADKLISVGDVISYDVKEGPLKGLTLTHRVEKDVYFNEGLNCFCVLTRGTKAGAPLDAPVPIENIRGVMVSKLTVLGKIYNVIKGPSGFLLLIILPCVILLILQIIRLLKIILNKNKPVKSRSEQVSDLKKEAISELIKMHPELNNFNKSEKSDNENLEK